MTRTITKQEAAGAFDELIGSLSNDNEAVIVDDAGERVAVIVSPDEFDRLSYDRFWTTVDRIRERNADKDPDEVLDFVTQVVEEVRQERYDREQSAS